MKQRDEVGWNLKRFYQVILCSSVLWLLQWIFRNPIRMPREEEKDTSSSLPPCGSKCTFLNNNPPNYGQWENKSKCMDYIRYIYQSALLSYLWSKLLRKISNLRTLCVMQRSDFKRPTPTDLRCVWFRREIALKILLERTYIPHPLWYLISNTVWLYLVSGTYLHTGEHVYGCFIITKIISQSCHCLYAYICTLTWDALNGDTVIRSFAWAWYFFGGLKGKMSLCTVQSVMAYFSRLCLIIKTREREGSNANIFCEENNNYGCIFHLQLFTTGV